MKIRGQIRRWAPSAIVFLAGAAMPFILQSGFQLRICMLIWVYAILGMGFNLLFGYTGQLSLGQQGFFAIGGYSLALLENSLGFPLIVAFPLSLVICAACGAIIGIPVLRLRSHYLAMATLMFGLIVEGLAQRWVDLTGGSAGLRVPLPVIAGWSLNRTEIYYFVFGLALISYLIHCFLVSTHIGRALQAIKSDETAAEALGINVTKYKLKVFVLAAVFAGLAGGSYAVVSRQVDPSYSALTVNINLLTLAVVGGLGTLSGPILGAIVAVLAPQFLANFREFEILLYGAGLLLFLIFIPRGLAGLIETRRGDARRTKLPPPPEAGVPILEKAQ